MPRRSGRRIAAVFGLFMLIAYMPCAGASVISHLPDGNAVVAQDEGIAFDILSSAISTPDHPVTFATNYGFGLTGHGDFHFDVADPDGDGWAGIADVAAGPPRVNLPPGTLISSSLTWSKELEEPGPDSNYVATDEYTEYPGPFGPQCLFGETCIFGLKFLLDENFHYGWVQFEETDPETQRLIAWAYEDVPGRGIRAGAMIPAPTPLALLALCLVGIDYQRRKQIKAE